MWDTNQSWQSEEFKKMLEYERNNDREKFIFDGNQMLKMYEIILNNGFKSLRINQLIDMHDPQLLSLIFSLISITYNKDDLSNYIKNSNLFDYMNSAIKVNDEHSTMTSGHTFYLPEKNLNIGEEFIIPKSTLNTYLEDENGEYKWVYNIADWEFDYDKDIISIDTGIVKALKKGCTIIKCTNKINNQVRRIKINSGQIKQSYITEYFFTQIRNIIAHGRFSIINSGGYDTLEEYQSYNMSSTDNRYLRGTQRDVLIYENNQLNITYGKNNTINPKYLIFLAQTLYAKKDNPFIKFIKIFDNSKAVHIAETFNMINSLSEIEKNDLRALLLLSKFYINFIYNYDSYDKNTYNYDKLPINKSIKKNLTNQEFIYEIRTAIMHGRYTYQNNSFTFWNNDKKDNSIKTFNATISNLELALLISFKEFDFYHTMKYDPNELIGYSKTEKDHQNQNSL